MTPLDPVSWLGKYKCKKTGKVRFHGTPALRTTQLATQVLPARALLRSYPRGLGECLLECWEQLNGWKIQIDLRQKKKLDPRKTDLQLFSELPLGDPWVDAQVPGLFCYLYASQSLRVPSEWQCEMDSMHVEMQKYVAGRSELLKLRLRS